MAEPPSARPAATERAGRKRRLSRSADFERVYRQGRSVSNRFLVLYAFPQGVESESRVGISVSRKIGGAVVRNRVKRLLREAFRALDDRVRAGHDFVIVARPDVRELGERDGASGVERTLAELLAQAGVLDKEAAA